MYKHLSFNSLLHQCTWIVFSWGIIELNFRRCKEWLSQSVAYKKIQASINLTIGLVAFLITWYGGVRAVHYKVTFLRDWCIDTFYLLRNIYRDVLVLWITLPQFIVTFFCKCLCILIRSLISTVNRKFYSLLWISNCFNFRLYEVIKNSY